MSEHKRINARREVVPLLAVLFLFCHANTVASTSPQSAGRQAGRFVVPVALSIPANKCRNVRVKKPVKAEDPFIGLNVLIAKGGALQVLFFVSSFPVEMPSGDAIRAGALYYQFDDNIPTYVESGSPEIQKRYGFYFQRLVFANLTAGSHRLSYGLASATAGFLSYGQVCFTVRDTNWQYFVGGFADEREVIRAVPPRR